MRSSAPGVILTALATLALTSPAFAAAPGPVLWKSSLRINVARYARTFATPTAPEPMYLTTSWYPRCAFTIQGPLPGGSQLSVSFTKPGGAPWVTIPLETPELPEGETRLIETPGDADKERQAINTTGVCSFTINLKNPLANTSSTLYKGTFTVAKFPIGMGPKEKNVFEFYVEHDWQLPIGYLYIDPREEEEAPRLHVVMWFRGDVKRENTEAFVFYKGKQLSGTEAGSVSIQATTTVQTPGALSDPRWDRCDFILNRIAGTNKMTSANTYGPDWIFLDKNPGEYEIKVLRNGKPARSLTFTVGADGKIVNAGLAEKNSLGTPWMLVPVKVLPGADGKANITAYQKDAFYGNALVGFPAP